MVYGRLCGAASPPAKAQECNIQVTKITKVVPLVTTAAIAAAAAAAAQ